jgi:hypothetical protein
MDVRRATRMRYRLLVAVALGASGLARGAGAQPVPRPGLAPGAVVRVRVVGRTAASRPEGLEPGLGTRATLLAIDSAAVTVRLQNGWQHTLPREDVARLDVRRGAGVCRGAARRAACTLAGGAAGLLLGHLTLRVACAACSHRAAHPDIAADADRATRPIVLTLGVVGGLAAGSLFGRDRWEPIRPWP